MKPESKPCKALATVNVSRPTITAHEAEEPLRGTIGRGMGRSTDDTLALFGMLALKRVVDCMRGEHASLARCV